MFKIKFCVLILIFSLFVVLPGCASKAKKTTSKAKATETPSWLLEPAKYYPSSNYFYSVGEGSERNIAELEAVKGVASSYGLDVSSSTSSSKRMSLAIENGTVASSGKGQGLSSDVLNQVSQENLVGIEAKEFWLDVENSKWYCLAILNKSSTADLYVSMINKNYKEILNLTNEAASKEVTLQTYARYDFAEEIAITTEKYFERLYILDWKKAEATENKNCSSKNLHLKKIEIAKQIPIYISIENDVKDQFANTVGNAITKYGFNSSSNPKERYSITAIADFNETENTKKTIKYEKCILPLQLNDSKDNQILITVNIEKREGSSTFDDAKLRAVNSVKKMISGDFDKEFNNYLGQMRLE